MKGLASRYKWPPLAYDGSKQLFAPSGHEALVEAHRQDGVTYRVERPDDLPGEPGEEFLVRITIRLLCLALIALSLAFSTSSPVAAHEERESQFPAGDGVVPKKRSLAQAADVIVVCKADSRKRIKKLPGKKLRARRRCG